MMKKLILFTGLIVIIMMCNCKPKTSDSGGTTTRSDTVASPKTTTVMVNKTLNNVNQHDAIRMIKFFDSLVYDKQKLPQLNFWFNREVIQDIVTLMKDDSIRQADAVHPVNGIRIYFASDTVTPSKVSILLITTDSSDIVNGIQLHRNYYSHSSDEHLFKSDTGIAGSVYKRGQDTGANLYYKKFTGIFDDISCKFSDHPHYIRRHTGRRMVNNFGTDVVNTSAEWFPTSLFKGLLDDSRCNGMRIYFAKHLPKGNIDTIYDNRDAFVIATTGNDSKINHNDYFDCHDFHRLFGGKRSKKNSMELKHSMKFERPFFSAGQDNGSLCPNNCNPTP